MADGKWLQTDEDDIGFFGGRAIVIARSDLRAGDRAAFGAALLHRGENVLRRDEAVLEEGFDQDAAHFSGAENRQSLLEDVVRHKHPRRAE